MTTSNKRARSRSSSSQTSNDSTSASHDPQQTKDLEDILRPHILNHLSKREFPKTICPSEVARALLPTQLSKGSGLQQSSDDEQTKLKDLGISSWRELMPTLRSLSFVMRDEGRLEILQKGEVVAGHRGIEDVTGPIRLRRLDRDVEHDEAGDSIQDPPAKDGEQLEKQIANGIRSSKRRRR